MLMPLQFSSASQGLREAGALASALTRFRPMSYCPREMTGIQSLYVCKNKGGSALGDLRLSYLKLFYHLNTLFSKFLIVQ